MQQSIIIEKFFIDSVLKLMYSMGFKLVGQISKGPNHVMLTFDCPFSNLPL